MQMHQVQKYTISKMKRKSSIMNQRNIDIHINTYNIIAYITIIHIVQYNYTMYISYFNSLLFDHI